MPAYSEDDLPIVSRFFPAPGVVVDRVARNVTIRAWLELSGPEATFARAVAVKKAIDETWTHTFANGRAVRCNATVRYRDPDTPPGYGVQIIARKMLESTGTGWKGNIPTIFLNANEPHVFTWIVAHEFGHVMGMDDQYIESMESQKAAERGGVRSVRVKPFYRGSLMGSPGGKLLRRTLLDLSLENAPGWFEEDDQVRAWMKGHTLFEIRQLPTSVKLQAIKTLMAGWISAEDMLVLRRIVACAASKEEADAIRRDVNLSKFFDLGQRTQMRVFLSDMPY